MALTKAAATRARRRARDRRQVATIPPELCRGFPQTVVRVMEESLLGDPQTIFVEDGSNENTGARGFRYFKAKSSNADWWQMLPDKLDRKEIRWAMSRVAKCEPLNFKRLEHRWLREFILDAKKRGWCAAFNGRESPLCVSPEPPLKRAKLLPGFRRVWLALNHPDYTRLALDAREVHESPNRFLTGLLRERWYDQDERRAIATEGQSGGRIAPASSRPVDDIPF